MATSGLENFLKILNKSQDPNTSAEHLISLLKRRQLRHSRSVALATIHLFIRVISAYRWSHVDQLLAHVRAVGRRLIAAQPREMAVGNMVRRVLGLIREEAEGDDHGGTSVYSDAGLDALTGRRPRIPTHVSQISPLKHGVGVATTSGTQPDEHQKSHTSRPQGHLFTSMFSLLSHPSSPTQSATSTPPTTAHASQQTLSQISLSQHALQGPSRDLKPGIIEGLQEILEELSTVDEQIASYALEHIHSNEIILTYGSSLTVHKFLMKAAAKRTFTVILAEGFPNDHEATHARVMGVTSHDGEQDEHQVSPEQFQEALTNVGITVILIPDAAVYALMSRVNKVILGTHAVLANGGLLAAAGARTIAKAANEHSTPVVIVTGIYKLSPVYPFSSEMLVELGDPGKIVPFDEPELVKNVEIINPVYDYVPAELVDLYITNLGGHAPSFLYRVVSDHYRTEDVVL